MCALIVKAQKNDELDAEAIAEAATRPTMRFVEVKSEAQSDVQALHRARERLVSERTALINHLRALLLERGIVVPQGRRKLEEELSVFADEDAITVLTAACELLAQRASQSVAGPVPATAGFILPPLAG
jgi:transposase